MEPKMLNISSYVSLEHIPNLWKQNDILIFIIDLDDYGTLGADHLDHVEKKHLKTLKTEYFKKRYKVSRMVLKYILCNLLDKQSVFDVSLYKDKYGRLHVYGHDELNICVSYTENISFLAISKIEVGIDVERRRHLFLENTSKYLQIERSCDGNCASDIKLFKEWTLKEAYCKFSNQNIFSYLNKAPDTNDIYDSSYLINSKYILTVVTGFSQYTININCFGKIFLD
ncbi:MAG: hypothetical protein SCH66_02340 [Methanolobus sp.]|nr:hypothetical protein [Methanolobus sp.]